MRFAALVLPLLLIPGPSLAAEALIAVATNFRQTAEALATDFAARTGDRIGVASASTGKLAAQIGAGAPFDAFLSADDETPARLVAAGLALDDTRSVYAVGTLALWSADAAAELGDPKAALAAARHIAMANPDLAPYGRAAVQTMANLGLGGIDPARIVTAENVGQAHALAASGAAELAFVAASSLMSGEGAVWTVPESMHDPIRQEAVLLVHGASNTAARGFLAYLATPPAHDIIAAAGYRAGE